MSGQFTRRELLRSSAAVAATSAFVSSCQSEAKVTAQPAPPGVTPAGASAPWKPLKLGLMSYTLAKDWDIDTIIKNCKETGFEHIELRTTHAHGVEVAMSKEQRQTVRQRFEDAGLKISLASGFAYHYPDPERLRKEIEGTKEYTILAQDVGARGFRVFPNALPGGKGIPEEQTMRQIGKALAEVCPFAHDHGIKIALEVHGSGTNIVGKVKQMIDYSECPYAYVNWNCDANDAKGPGLEANFASVKDRIANVHMHELHENYPYRRLFELLRQAGYNGYCDAEIDASKEPIRLMKYYRATFLALQDVI
jgi:sugar phosphate isomerase/epimerase